MSSLQALDRLFAAVLRGEASVWPDDWRDADQLEEAWRRLIYHGISGLLVQREELLINWPFELIERIKQQARAQAFWELRHKELIREVIETLDKQGIASAVLKGTAIAYSLYELPAARARGDTDLLIAKDDLDLASSLLKALGWTSLSATHGIFGDVEHQDLWRYRDAAGYSHDLDLHWELTNSIALRSTFRTEAILEDSVALPRLSANAQGTAKPVLLMHIIVNRLRHGQTGYYSIDKSECDPDRLIWAYDIKLLCETLNTLEWQSFVSAASANGLAKLFLEAFEFADRTLGLSAPDEICASLASLPQETPTARYFEAKTGFDRAVGEWRATKGIRQKLSLVMARTFPSPALLRMKYPEYPNVPVAFLYLKRIADAFSSSTESSKDK